MLQNYLTIAMRSFRRNIRYLLINVLGLGIALAFCILSFTNYRFAHSFDNWHPDKERIFRIETYKASNHVLHGVCPATLPPAAAADIAGVEAATRIDSRRVVMKYGESVFNEQVHFVDANFLKVFYFPLEKGQARLSDRNALLISEKMAGKYFGKEDPVGKSLTLYADTEQRMTLTVSGVFRDCPKNSSIRMDFLTELDNQYDGDQPVRYDSWKWFVDAAFVRLRDPSDAPAVEAALAQYVAPQNQGNSNWQAERYRLEALPVMALHGREIRWNNLMDGLPPSAVWGNITLAIMLLLTACLNFANTTISIGNRRLREMGVRKAMGGTQFQLMRQLLSEALVVCAAAVATGMIIAFPMAEWYSSTWEHLELDIRYSDPRLMLFIVSTLLFTTLLAGAYPAFFITRFNPSSIFRGTLRFGGASLFSRLMMGLQVAIALAAVVVGFSFAYNARMQETADLGYNRKNLLGFQADSIADLKRFQQILERNPKVVATAGTRHVPGFGYRRAEISFEGENAETAWFDVGKDFMSVMGMELYAGETFPAEMETEPGKEVLVNQTFVREVAGGGEVIGKFIRFDTMSFRIAGVVRDFMADSPFDAPAPVMLRRVPERLFSACMVKTRPEDLSEVFAFMESEWKKIFPYKPFSGFYQSEVLRETLEVSRNIAMTMLVFSIVILLLTISGLFSIVSLNAIKQWRGLAMRRVLGASSMDIAYHLNRNHLYVMLGATIAGCLGGRIFALAMMNSIYKIHAGVGLGVMVFAACSVLLVMIGTIGLKVWQVWRASLSEALKAE
ncbi:MAG: ABC transporter permease [Saprospiraceae bacterium]|nr:ABC transporter permease [Saprospiraceae bacterium]